MLRTFFPITFRCRTQHLDRQIRHSPKLEHCYFNFSNHLNPCRCKHLMLHIRFFHQILFKHLTKQDFLTSLHHRTGEIQLSNCAASWAAHKSVSRTTIYTEWPWPPNSWPPFSRFGGIFSPIFEKDLSCYTTVGEIGPNFSTPYTLSHT